MSPEELEEVTEEVKETLCHLIDMGVVEITAIDEDGNFCYGLTEHGREVAEEAKRLDLK
jgi:acyl-CoA hydrolase